MSTIIEPVGSAMLTPAPTAAAKGSSIKKARRPNSRVACRTARRSTSVTPEGTQTMICGLKKRPGPVITLRTNAFSIFSVRS